MSSRLEVDIHLRQRQFTLQVRCVAEVRTLGVHGASGSGKTSLLEAIAGWRRPDAGRLVVDGVVMHDSARRIDLPPEQRGIGHVPQDALLWPHWTVGRNMRAGARRLDSAGEALLARTAEMLDIDKLLERGVGSLSGGERQRVALARALVGRPRLLLLDEPLAALDAPLRRRILAYLLRVRDELRVPTVFVSHDASEVQAMCDEVLVLDSGRVVAQGEPATVLRAGADAQAGLDNVLAGLVIELEDGVATLELDGGVRARVPSRGLEPGRRIAFAVHSDEVLLARGATGVISARNRLPARVECLADVGGAVRVDARLVAQGRGSLLSATVTRGAVEELGLAPGAEVECVFKASACRVWSAPGR